MYVLKLLIGILHQPLKFWLNEWKYYFISELIYVTCIKFDIYSSIDNQAIYNTSFIYCTRLGYVTNFILLWNNEIFIF